MSQHDQVMTRATAPLELFGCAGLTRFNKPCANRVPVQGGFCGRCHGSRLAPTPGPTGPPDPSEPNPGHVADAARPGSVGANDWTIANELVARLTPVAGGDAELLALVEVGARLAENSRATNTKASYQQHWRTFTTFGDAHGLSTELPVEPDDGGCAEEVVGVGGQQADGEVACAGALRLAERFGDLGDVVAVDRVLAVDVGAVQLGVALEDPAHDRVVGRVRVTVDGVAVTDGAEPRDRRGRPPI